MQKYTINMENYARKYLRYLLLAQYHKNIKKHFIWSRVKFLSARGCPRFFWAAKGRPEDHAAAYQFESYSYLFAELLLFIFYIPQLEPAYLYFFLRLLIHVDLLFLFGLLLAFLLIHISFYFYTNLALFTYLLMFIFEILKFPTNLFAN